MKYQAISAGWFIKPAACGKRGCVTRIVDHCDEITFKSTPKVRDFREMQRIGETRRSQRRSKDWQVRMDCTGGRVSSTMPIWSFGLDGQALRVQLNDRKPPSMSDGMRRDRGEIEDASDRPAVSAFISFLCYSSHGSVVIADPGTVGRTGDDGVEGRGGASF